ncbi:aminodeoxychorismate lyase [Veronia pacifica]|uniref:Aminodeoxychorismate lyase n=1 Tax=Veronia pacifica TaxID=1080227 RepID=A0A1C3EPS6_9GAMM|nr:aminodeoxychorismate lyase [Veronia pacifica]ODA35189.1 aminodeoxychorismate lyase [Veronia pacifica]
MVLLNGINTQQIEIADRGLQYGDGCFTTALLIDGKPQYWPSHQARLENAVKALAIPFQEWKDLNDWVKKACADIQEEKAVLKVMITRGSGGRGYSPKGCSKPNVLITSSTFPQHYEIWAKKGIQLAVLRSRLGHSPLAGIKHLNRLEQVIAKAELDELNVEDGIVCDMQGAMVETTASNLFWRVKNTLFTPRLSCAGVEGIMKMHITKCAKECGYEINEVEAEPSVLEHADEVFITNTLMGIIPVNQCDSYTFTSREALELIGKRLKAC